MNEIGFPGFQRPNAEKFKFPCFSDCFIATRRSITVFGTGLLAFSLFELGILGLFLIFSQLPNGASRIVVNLQSFTATITFD